ncbi:2,3-bisphosphoglycerate-dependent phosphoglycerate mutase [Pedobacter sp. KBW06]|uniref:2,3-bisphosphoglycerate-dependent phosphoglycerate mutase n=1 Tax=Pedobacter sp. KBW06 TaxID=2153359 RepID=UPI000F5AA371|nr:2,3-bisphosphoglycerate-dependent phosphoglycerate mutase [Pedobacter sp. KBW06]RQO74489.1 2,3-bisphosphoglycerate-dependent phosphoglycerate mutase [Pedobacter sp. KBW06]
MTSKLILVRHGQSLWNLENRFTGWQDVDITEKGKAEAQNAGILLRDIKIDIAFTSTLLRAQHTLDIILQKLGLETLPIIKDKALNERCYGDLEGLNKADTAEKYGEEQVHIWRRSYDIAPPGGESLKDTYNRVIPYFLDNILPLLKTGNNIVIVAHGNSMRALIMFLENLSPEEILKKELPTGIPEIYNLDENRLFSITKSVSRSKN